MSDARTNPDPHGPDDELGHGDALDQAAVEAAAIETHRATHPSGPTDTQGEPAGSGDATPDGDVTQPLGGSHSGEDGYVAVSPGGVSGEQDAALTVDDEDPHSADPEANAHRGDIGANRGGSGGR